jgi:hypothetical protein
MQLFLVISKKMKMTVFDYNELNFLILSNTDSAYLIVDQLNIKINCNCQKKLILISITQTSTNARIDPQKSRNNTDHVTNKISQL